MLILPNERGIDSILAAFKIKLLFNGTSEISNQTSSCHQIQDAAFEQFDKSRTVQVFLTLVIFHKNVAKRSSSSNKNKNEKKIDERIGQSE